MNFLSRISFLLVLIGTALPGASLLACGGCAEEQKEAKERVKKDPVPERRAAAPGRADSSSVHATGERVHKKCSCCEYGNCDGNCCGKKGCNCGFSAHSPAGMSSEGLVGHYAPQWVVKTSILFQQQAPNAVYADIWQLPKI